MPKGYLGAHVDAGDPAGYQADTAANAAPFAGQDARILLRGAMREDFMIVEGYEE